MMTTRCQQQWRGGSHFWCWGVGSLYSEVQCIMGNGHTGPPCKETGDNLTLPQLRLRPMTIQRDRNKYITNWRHRGYFTLTGQDLKSSIGKYHVLGCRTFMQWGTGAFIIYKLMSREIHCEANPSHVFQSNLWDAVQRQTDGRSQTTFMRHWDSQIDGLHYSVQKW